jgi:hypothetical protein
VAYAEMTKNAKKWQKDAFFGAEVGFAWGAAPRLQLQDSATVG